MRQDIFYNFDTGKLDFRDIFSQEMKNPDEIWFNFS